MWFEIVFPLLLFLAGVLIYSNTLKRPFVFDDRLHIPENHHIRLEQLNIRDIFAAGYHCVNIAIHILTAIFIYLLVKETLRTPALKDKYKYANPMAFFAVFS